MFYNIIFSHLITFDYKITPHCISLLNHADPELLVYMQYHINQVDPSKGETYQLAKQFSQQLIESTQEVIGQQSMYKDGKFTLFSSCYIFTYTLQSFSVSFPTTPETEVTAIIAYGRCHDLH